MNALLVLLGGMVGAPVRYLVDVGVRTRWAPRVPWGTFGVNVAGSALLGGLAGAAALPESVALLVGTGFCGALTTFSTFGYETLLLLDQRARRVAVGYALGSLAASVAAASACYALVAALT